MNPLHVNMLIVGSALVLCLDLVSAVYPGSSSRGDCVPGPFRLLVVVT